MSELTQPNLLKTLGFLELAGVLLLDVLRGRPVTKQEVRQVRRALLAVRVVVQELDETEPWLGFVLHAESGSYSLSGTDL